MKIKKIMAGLLVAVMVFGITPVNGFVGLDLPKINGFEKISNSVSDFFGGFVINAKAATEYTEGAYTYTLDNYNQATLTAYYGNASSLTIPETIGGYTVVGLGSRIFKDNKNLTSAVISDSVTSIGTEAFCGCTNLSSVHLSSSLKTMEYAVFMNCASLTEILIPKSLEEAGNTNGNYGCFKGCIKLKKVTFEEGTTRIAENLFANSEIEEITIPNTVTSIDNWAFEYCYKLKKVTFGNSITKIGYYAFEGCTSLEEAIIPDTVTMIGDHAFDGCNTLKAIEIINPDATIESYAFRNCSLLETVALPQNLVIINSYLFCGCSSLKSIEIPQFVTTIGEYAFYNCDSLKSVEIPSKVQKIGLEAFRDSDSLETIVISDSVSTMNNYAFAECEKLKNVSLSKGLSEISASAFYACPALEEIVIPKGVKKINQNAFKNCTTLKKIVIPITVTSIDLTTFSYPDKTVIYGCRGSYADSFATQNNFAFVDITKNITGMVLKGSDDEIFVLTKGTYATPEFDYLPTDTTDIITLKSNNTSIVTVKNNQLYGYSNGTATVTATTSGGLEYTFNVYVRTLNSISITNKPAKTSYKYGEKLDITGLAVVANYADGATETVTDYTVSGYDPNKYGTQTVTVTYNGKKATFGVEVIDDRVKVTSIAITSLPNKLAYNKGETFNPDGIVVTAYYSDGSSAPVNGYSISTMNSLKNGSQTLTVTYEGFVATFTVTVGNTAAVLSSIAVKTNPNKTIYNVGESFDSTGLVLTATYSDSSTKNISTGYTVSGFSSSTAGQKAVTITYEGKTAILYVTVKENEPGKYTITFNTNGGSTVNSIIAIEGSSVSAPQSPTKIGYTFVGWTDSNGNNVSFPMNMPSRNTTLYAKWDGNIYTIKWIVEGEETKVSVKCGQKITKPANPTKEGYKFTGWTPSVPPTMPAENKTFTAVFEKAYPAAKIKNNSGTKTINYGDGIKFTAEVMDLPDGAKIVWFVDAEEKGTGESFTFSNATADATITVKIVDKNGNSLKDANGGEISESEKISVKAGFFQKLISFFKNLFKINRIIAQSIDSKKVLAK